MIRLSPRLDEPLSGERALRLLAGVLAAIVAGAALLLAAGYDPIVAFRALLRGAFGSERAVYATLNKAVPIGLCAVGIALAHRAKLWNIGAEGQLYFGAFAAAGVGLFLPQDTPAALALPLLLAAGLLGGAFFAALAALPRAFLGVNEILSTLMLSYVATLWVDYLVTGPWADPRTFSFPYTAPLIPGARMGDLVGALHLGIVALVAAVIGLWVLDRGLRVGYVLRVFGDAPDAARYGGIGEKRVIVCALVGAGMLAGLAGAIEVWASTGRLQSGLSPGYGFMGIMVAWLADGRPLGILLASVLYAALLNGGFALQIAGIPPAIGTILQATLLICVSAAIGLSQHRVAFGGRAAAR